MVDHQRLAQCLNILAIFFRYPPSSDNFQSIANFFQSDWIPEWIEVIDESQQCAALSETNELTDEEWQQNFGMEQVLTAPPWGSVYTDPEQVLYGATTVALQAELDSMGFAFQSEVKEPVDHIGLILMVMANIAQSNDLKTLERFQESHLTPWVEDYLRLLTESTNVPSILAATSLLSNTLAWKDKR